MRELMVAQIVAAMVSTINTDEDYERLSKQAERNDFVSLRNYLAFESSKQVDAIVELCEMQFETKILNAMRGRDKNYTKSLYNEVSGKADGYSLNKFRDVMYKLEREGKIIKSADHPSYPYWTLVKRKPLFTAGSK